MIGHPRLVEHQLCTRFLSCLHPGGIIKYTAYLIVYTTWFCHIGAILINISVGCVGAMSHFLYLGYIVIDPPLSSRICSRCDVTKSFLQSSGCLQMSLCFTNVGVITQFAYAESVIYCDPLCHLGVQSRIVYPFIRNPIIRLFPDPHVFVWEQSCYLLS